MLIKYTRLLLAVLVFVVLAGCATSPSKVAATIISKKSESQINIITFDSINVEDPEVKLRIFSVALKSKKGQVKLLSVRKKNILICDDNSTSYALFCLEPGDWNLHSIRGQISWLKGMPLFPSFEIPISAKLDSEVGRDVYLGNIRATLRKTTNVEEIRAGPVMPILDQAYVKNKTFDVVINDNFQSDVSKIKKLVPELENINFEVNLLPAWIKPDKNTFKPKFSSAHFF